MISVRGGGGGGVKNARKGMELGFENGDMDEPELEEGEASFDSSIDPDVALSYLDEKLQHVLGHFQKDFEGCNISAENLGAKFGGYGSFLPTYQRSPSWSCPRSPPEVSQNRGRSPNTMHLEGARRSSLSSSSNIPSTGPRLTSSTGHGLKAPSGNNQVNPGVGMPSNGAEELSSKVEPHKLNRFSDQKALKFRIKVGVDNSLTGKNAEIYSGLGLDVSPSSSLDNSPTDSDMLYHDHQEIPDDSPTSILQIMSSIRSFGGLLLSPLSDKVTQLSGSRGPIGRGQAKPGSSRLPGSGFDPKTSEERKPKAVVEPAVSEPSSNTIRDELDRSCDVRKKDDFDTSACEELVSNALKLPLLSNSPYDAVHSAKDTVKSTTTFKTSKSGIKSSVRVEEDLVTQNGRSEKLNKKARRPNYVDENLAFQTKAESLVKKESDVYEERKSVKVDDILKEKVSQRVPSHNEEVLKNKIDQKVAFHDVDDSKSAPGELQSLSGGKKKPKGSLGPSVLSTDLPENGSLVNSSVVAKGKKTSDSDGVKKGPGKALDKYKEFFGDLDIEQDDEEIASQENTSGSRFKESELAEKNVLSGRSTSYDRVNGAGSHPKLLPSRPRPVHDTNTPMVPPLVQEDWVACDRCQTWRLLPLGTNPESLPEKWLCSMLDWLPEMNRCSISEEDTTKALRALYQPQPSLVPLTDASGSQLDQHAPPCQNSLGVLVSDGRRSSENRPNSGLQATNSVGKRKSGAKDYSSTEELGSQLVDKACGSFGDKYGMEKEKRIFLDSNCEEAGDSKSKIKDRKENDTDLQRASKKIKTEDQQNRDGNRSSDLGGASTKAGRSSNSVPGKDFHKGDACLKIDKSGSDGSVKKRKQSQHQDGHPDCMPLPISEHHSHASRPYLEDSRGSERRRDKKARVSKSEGKDSSGSKNGSVSGKKGRDTADYKIKQDLDGTPSRRSMDAVGPGQPSVAATSSSSKVSSSRKSKTSLQEVKDSPVESVSSSPVRVSGIDKLIQVRKNILAKDDSQDVKCFPSASPRRSSEREDIGVGDQSVTKKGNSFSVSHRGADFRGRDSDYRSATGNAASLTDLVTQKAPNCKSTALGQETQDSQQMETSEQIQTLGKSFTSKAKEKTYNSIAGLENGNEAACEETAKAGRIKYPSSSSDRTEKHFMHKKDYAGKVVEDQSHISGHDSTIAGPDVFTSHEKQNALQDSDNERSSRKLVSDKTGTEVPGRGKSHSLPPVVRGQTDAATRLMPIAESQKEYGEHREHDAKLRASKQPKKAEKQNGNQHSSLRHPTPPSQKGHDIEAPSPARKDSSSQAVTNAVKEAKDLKHLADRLKNSGSPDSTGYYFQAALKFLHGASLLESGSGENAKHSEIFQSIQMYSSTAKLCEFCAHEYEKSKDTAAAALAYKCVEVAYLRVVYNSHSASRDRNELLAALQITPTGESPSSSASDIDNLNTQVAVEKGVQAKSASPHIAGNHVLTARNRQSCMRLINYAQEMNNAMEASRKSRNAFAAANARVDTAKHKEGISSVKKALDFNFQDVEGLLRLVRVAIEAVEFQLKSK